MRTNQTAAPRADRWPADGVHVPRIPARRRREWAVQLPGAIESALSPRQASASPRPEDRGLAPEPGDALEELLARLFDAPSRGPARTRLLHELRARIGGAQFALLAHALAIADLSTRPRTAVFECLARRLRERSAAERQLAGLRARARAWTVTAGALPLAVLAWLVPRDFAAARVGASRLGSWLLLALLVALTLRGLDRLRRVARIDAPEG